MIDPKAFMKIMKGDIQSINKFSRNCISTSPEPNANIYLRTLEHFSIPLVTLLR